MPATLEEKLAGLRRATADKLPADAREVMHASTEALAESGQAERAVGEGDELPAFEAPAPDGTLVSSSDLLARGPLVLTFFRGHW